MVAKQKRQRHIIEFRRTGDEGHLRDYYRRPEYVRNYKNAPASEKDERKFAYISQVMGLKDGDVLLDVGCGGQHLRPHVEARGAKYRSYDLVPELEPDYVGSAEDMSQIPDDSFDWVVMADILEHLPNPNLAVREARRIGRNLLTVVPCMYHLEAVPFLPRYRGDRHLTKQRPKKWYRLIESGGWRISRSRGYCFLPSLAFVPLPGLLALDRFLQARRTLNKLDLLMQRRVAGRAPLKYLAQELVITAHRDEA